MLRGDQSNGCKVYQFWSYFFKMIFFESPLYEFCVESFLLENSKPTHNSLSISLFRRLSFLPSQTFFKKN
jgi:hypothetical protein